MRLLKLFRHYERQPEQYPKSGDGYTSGLGVGLLAAAATACSRTLVDLPRVAAQMVPIAFRTGAVVDKILQQLHQTRGSGGNTCLYVPNPDEETVQVELNSFYENLVSSPTPTSYKKRLLSDYRMFQSQTELSLE